MIRLARRSAAAPASVLAQSSSLASASASLSSVSPLPPASCLCSASLGMRPSARDARRLPRLSRRLQHTASASASTATLPSEAAPSNKAKSILASIVDHSTSLEHDDKTLRKIFDSSSAWLEFSNTNRGKSPVGLFRNAYLTAPGGFLTFAQVSLDRAKALVDKILSAASVDEYRQIVRDMDRLSDILCRVIDLSDFVRNTHPRPDMQAAASQAWFLVFEYMNLLNTTNGLNEQLNKAMNMHEVYDSWNAEERTVAEILRLDFTKSAINLPEEARAKFIQLSSQIGEVGQDFVDEMAPKTPTLSIPSVNLQGRNPGYWGKRINSNKEVKIQTLGTDATMVLRTVHNESTRKEVYMASRTASPKTIERLETMLRLRAELADLAGFESYSHMVLRDRMMAKTPENVNSFLQNLMRSNKDIVKREMVDLTAMKRTNKGHTGKDIRPWDKEYYMELIRSASKSMNKYEDSLSAYFSLGTVMQGLSRLFTRLYGIRFVPRETMPGEVWHRDVRRLDVISDTDGFVAVLYCDLFFREGKAANPAHFTVRCSREIQEHELREAEATGQQPYGGNLPTFASAEEAANDGMALARDNEGRLKQLPTIALVCDFPQSHTAGDRPAFLTYGQLETLFHEMGHAIHSILARTSLHNVSGTRCATDLAELPSTLMELFCADPAVLSLFARHWQTDRPLNYRMVTEQLQQARLFAGIDTEHQILLAMLDQHYHSEQVTRAVKEGGPFNYSTTKVLYKVQQKWCDSGSEPLGTSWQGFFGHLFGYGSSYYSYLFDRVLADRVWFTVFDSGVDGAAISREKGERLKENLLKHGGGRGPWECLSETLQDPRLLEGGAQAMALVGSWGTGPCFKRS